MKLKIWILLLCVLVVTGCKGPPDINHIGIVAAVAIDKDPEDDGVVVTVQVIRPGALDRQRPAKEGTVELVTSKGKTVFEAVRDTTQKFDRRNFYGHTKVIVIGEKLAREDLTPILDFFIRGREFRGYTTLCIAKNAPAKDIISVKDGINAIQANYLNSLAENQRYQNKITKTSVIDYYRKALGEGINPVVGAMEIIEVPNEPAEEKEEKVSRQVKSAGTAVFKKDALVGFFNEEETVGLNWITGKDLSGSIVTSSLLEPNRHVSCEVISSKSKIIPEIKENTITFTIKIQTNVSLVEEQGKAKIIYPKDMLDYLDKVKGEIEKKITEESNQAIYKAQKEFKSDVFGFGSILNDKDPEQWHKVKDQWHEIFPNVNYTIEVEVKFVGTKLKQGVFDIEEK